MIGMKFFREYYFTGEFNPQMKWKAKTFSVCLLKKKPHYIRIKNVISFTDDFVKLLWNLLRKIYHLLPLQLVYVYTQRENLPFA